MKLQTFSWLHPLLFTPSLPLSVLSWSLFLQVVSDETDSQADQGLQDLLSHLKIIFLVSNLVRDKDDLICLLDSCAP